MVHTEKSKRFGAVVKLLSIKTTKKETTVKELFNKLANKHFTKNKPEIDFNEIIEVHEDGITFYVYYIHTYYVNFVKEMKIEGKFSFVKKDDLLSKKQYIKINGEYFKITRAVRKAILLEGNKLMRA